MVSVVISYCNNDLQFIAENIMECKKFSDDIIVPFFDCSLDGIEEDSFDLSYMQDICFFKNAKSLPLLYEPTKSPVYHHNKMRWHGLLNAKHDYVLFLDADEIIEGQLMFEWLQTREHKDYDVISFECYWYFREKRFRAKTTEQAAVLCNKRICTEDYIYSPAERWEFFNRLQYVRALQHKKINDRIVCHHYSWVRDKEQMLRKVKSWGHRNDKDWVKLVEEEFSRPFTMKDFVHNYEFENIQDEKNGQ